MSRLLKRNLTTQNNALTHTLFCRIAVINHAIESKDGGIDLTSLRRVESRSETVKELVEAQFPVCVFIGELNKSIHTETSVKHTNHAINADGFD